MIECKDCALPTLPPVLFWEGILNMRLPCLCGCAERVRDGEREAVPVQTIDPDLYAQLRAGDEGMPDNAAEDARFMAVTEVGPGYVFQTASPGRAQDFRKWLETRDKKTLAATAANTDTAVVVRQEFRPVRLRKIFGPLSGRPMLVTSAAHTDDPNPYMSGMEKLEKVF